MPSALRKRRRADESAGLVMSLVSVTISRKASASATLVVVDQRQARRFRHQCRIRRLGERGPKRRTKTKDRARVCVCVAHTTRLNGT